MKRWPLCLMAVLWFGACAETDAPKPENNVLQAPAIEAAPPNAVVAVVESVAETGLVAPQTRPPKRINVRQLDRSMQRIFGYSWNELEELALTLGQPDLVEITQEDLSISPLFLKFLNDAARATCAARVAMDFTENIDPLLVLGVAATDTFDTAPDAMEAALKGVLLTFHGRRVEGDELARWKLLFTTAAAESPEIGWRTVCVAAMTHPDFYTY